MTDHYTHEYLTLAREFNADDPFARQAMQGEHIPAMKKAANRYVRAAGLTQDVRSRQRYREMAMAIRAHVLIAERRLQEGKEVTE